MLDSESRQIRSSYIQNRKVALCQGYLISKFVLQSTYWSIAGEPGYTIHVGTQAIWTRIIQQKDNAIRSNITYYYSYPKISYQIKWQWYFLIPDNLQNETVPPGQISYETKAPDCLPLIPAQTETKDSNALLRIPWYRLLPSPSPLVLAWNWDDGVNMAEPLREIKFIQRMSKCLASPTITVRRGHTSSLSVCPDQWWCAGKSWGLRTSCTMTRHASNTEQGRPVVGGIILP